MHKPSPLSDARVIGVAYTYQDFMKILSTRSEQLEISRLTIDVAGGLQSGYAAKLLAPISIRNIGPLSFGGLLKALGLAIVVIEDQSSAGRVAKLPRSKWRKPRVVEVKGEKAKDVLRLCDSGS